ncbi:MAG: single-stranded DNA-binding protein [Candidatus Methanomethylophilaceae archaeon]|nr:single-stranded DNA-binding protein [Candidatus Methanomethylophilaceae archaeon]
MENEDLTPHIEEIKRVLKDKITDEQIHSELNKYLNEYHVGIEPAKRGIIRKYGGDDTHNFGSASIVKKVAELTGAEQNVDLQVKAVFVDNKTISIRGESKQIISGLIGDETGTVSFTVWDPGSLVLTKGDNYTFRNCYCKTFNDKVQVNVGKRGRIEALIGTEIDVPKRELDLSETVVKINEIRDGMNSITLTAKVVSFEERSITVRGEPRTVYSGILADDTGRIQYSAWKNIDVKEGDTVCIKYAYTKAWRGIPQLNIGDRCEVSRVDSDMEIADVDSSKTIAEMCAIGGGLDISIDATIVDLRTGSGLIKRCPTCNRSILNGTCTLHGAVEGIDDLRMKIVVDDGTGALAAIINKADTEKMAKMPFQEALDLAAAYGNDYVEREIASRVLMKRVRMRGNVVSDDYGPSMIVRSIDELKTDVREEAEALLKEMEAVF